MLKRLVAITLILVFSLLATGCWQALAARRAAKRVEDGNGPLANAYDEITEDNDSSE
ncbi:hypothetical protein [Rubellicoccus peritrichatus]|uniref:Uncharacterized protein n=1 Tax=Rubellicoccus peritrichatus TaxID=3080537 RepID=A0AAQ3LBI1_9BACT|nr:hypothetical protein [Puniceicoccus sp. CR14]WOO42815.1 hypothetical protein RZN69_06900 [Puniceicoccus sp. CR14]